MTFKTEYKNLIFTNGESVCFEHPVKEALEVDGVIILVTDIPFDKKYERNVFAFSNRGDFLWQIGHVDLFHKGADCVYLGVELNHEQEVVLFNWCDTAVIVDVGTGEVKRTYVTK